MKNKASFFLSITLEILKYALIVFLVAFVLTCLSLFGAWSDFKNLAQKGIDGRGQLTSALSAIKEQNWEQALKDSEAAQSSFEQAIISLESARYNPALKYVGLLSRQADDLNYLLKSGEILSKSLLKIIPLASNLDAIRKGAISGNFVSLSPEAKANFLRLIYQAEPELRGLRANLELVFLNLDKTHRLGVLWPVYGEISDLKNDLEQIITLLDRSSPLVKLLPVLSGYPQSSKFLFIMQNNDELRPSGGFIGVYGLMEVKNGEILNLETNDSYHLDMPASLTDSWRLEPPAIMQKHLKTGKWYLRDANWSPDWPQSAQQINYIYNGISEATNKVPAAFNGIIGITPDLIADLIGLVGPIEVRGEVYTPENFQPLLQYNVEIAYREQDISQWDRKEVVGEIMDELKERLFHLPSGKWMDLLMIFDQAINERDLQIYFANNTWQKLARELGASGEVQSPVGDYLMVVDANLAAFKSDAVVRKNISYQVSERTDALEVELKLDYRHEGGFDWRTTRYRSYTRVYVPIGSQFLSLSGLDEAVADKSISEDKILNKNVFGFFFVVEPGSARTITLRYRLPDEIYRHWLKNEYRLVAQKQAGRRTDNLSVIFEPINGSRQSWSTDFSVDRHFWFQGGR